MGLLDVGAGGAAGLEELFARQMLEDKLAEAKRSTKADEGYRERALGENVALRKSQQDFQNQERQRQDEDRNQSRTLRTVGMRPIGATVTPEEMNSELAAGVPSDIYKEHLPQVESNTTAGGATPPSRGASGGAVGAPIHTANESAPGRIEFTGTEGQRTAEERITNAESNARIAQGQRDEALAQGQHRENRLTDWGPPAITIGDPTNPAGARVIPRSGLPPEGAAAPPTGAQRTASSDSQVALDTAAEVLKTYKPDFIGPVSGRVQNVESQVPFMPIKQGYPEFKAAVAQLRNATIKAITGAQMSEPEARRIMQQIPDLSQRPEIFEANLRATLRNLQDVVSKKGAMGAGTGGGSNVMGDLYQQYLAGGSK